MPPKIDLTNRRFGRLVALEDSGERRSGMVVWRCLCDCGTETFVISNNLVRGITRSCGCLARETASRTKAKDIAGQRFGRLVAIEDSGKRSHSHILWRCICDCGNETLVTANNLLKGKTRSCGCLRTETTIERSTKHGGAHLPEYHVWTDIKNRCYNENCSHYRYYGGRGIQVCARWRDSFANFYSDMGPRPSPRHTIDRIDNDGDYEPDNCRWATYDQQSQNRTSTKLTAQDVRDIRARAAEGEQCPSIAKDYPVGEAHISAIIARKKWRNID